MSAHESDPTPLEVAHASTTLRPEDGWRFVDGRSEPWRGWRVSLMDARGKRRQRTSFVLYDEHVSRDTVAAAVAAFIEGRHR